MFGTNIQTIWNFVTYIRMSITFPHTTQTHPDPDNLDISVRPKVESYRILIPGNFQVVVQCSFLYFVSFQYSHKIGLTFCPPRIVLVKQSQVCVCEGWWYRPIGKAITQHQSGKVGASNGGHRKTRPDPKQQKLFVLFSSSLLAVVCSSPDRLV